MRPQKDEYYLNIAKEVAMRSTCFRVKVGAIIVRDDQIISTGYAGAPRKTKDCLERNECIRDKLNIPHGKQYEMCRSVHAEMNAVINAARAGVSLLGGTMYLYIEDRNGQRIDSLPCFICKKVIINAGINRMVCSTKTPGEMRIFYIQDWIDEWREKDIIDDKDQYGKEQNERENRS